MEGRGHVLERCYHNRPIMQPEQMEELEQPEEPEQRVW